MNSGDILKIALVAMAFVVASCGSKKNLVDTNKGVDATTAATKYYRQTNREQQYQRGKKCDKCRNACQGDG